MSVALDLTADRAPSAICPSRADGEAALAAILQHPAFPEAMRKCLGVIVGGFSSNRLANQVLGDRGRAVFALFCLYLHYVPQAEGTAGLTVTRAQELCQATGLCSRGRAATLLALLRFGGYLAPAVSTDRRCRMLVPTARLLREQRGRWTAQFVAMAPLFADAGPIADLLTGEEFTCLFLRRLGARYIAGYRVLDAVPALSELAESNGAFLILGSLLLDAAHPLPDGGAPVEVSTSSLARRFGVARAHVRGLLVRAEQVGLLERAAEPGFVIVLPSLLDAMHRFFASMFLLFALCGSEALADHTQGR